MKRGNWCRKLMAVLAVFPTVVAASAVANGRTTQPAQAGRFVCNPECHWSTVEDGVPPSPPSPPPQENPRPETVARRPDPGFSCNPDCRPVAEDSPPPVLGETAKPGTARSVTEAAPPSTRQTRGARTESVLPGAKKRIGNEANAVGIEQVVDASRMERLRRNLATEGLHIDPVSLQGGSTFDLWRVVQLAVQRYPSIRSAMAAVGQQQAAVDEARAGYYPTVQVGMNTGYQGGFGNSHALNASVTQTVWDFGKVKNSVSLAEAGVRTRQLEADAEMDAVAKLAALTAIEVERNAALEASARSQFDAVNELLDLVRRRTTEGASTKADLALAEARAQASKATLEGIAAQVRQQRSKLAILIGEDVPAGGVAIRGDALRNAVAGIRPDVEDALTVKIAESEKEAAVSNLALAKSNMKPTASVQASVSQYLGGASSFQRSGQTYMVTFGVSHNLFQGGGPSARVRGAGEALRGAEERIRTERLQAEEERRVQEVQIASLGTRVVTLASRQKGIVETQRLYREQYLSLGTRSLLDLLNTEAEIFQAASEEINARYDLWMTQVSYINSTGYMHQVFNLVKVW